jgi:hypothetical protein
VSTTFLFFRDLHHRENASKNISQVSNSGIIKVKRYVDEGDDIFAVRKARAIAEIEAGSVASAQ